MTTGTGRPYLSVVIPAHNDQEALARTLPAVEAYLAGARIDAEIVVSDDASTDGTSQAVSSFLHGKRGRLIGSPERRGTGHAIRQGVLKAQGRWVLISDARLSTPIEAHAELARAARAGDLDLVVGSRPTEAVYPTAPRRAVAGLHRALLRTLSGLRFHDLQCTFKLFDLERMRPLLEKMVVDRFAFDVEMLFLCERFGLAAREVPVSWRDTGKGIQLLTDPPRALLETVRIRWNFRRGVYHPNVDESGRSSSGR